MPRRRAPFLPSAALTTCSVRAREPSSDTHATSAPSGDHAGSKSLRPLPTKITAAAVPSAERTASLPRAVVTAIDAPSGENAAPVGSPGASGTIAAVTPEPAREIQIHGSPP